MATRVQRSIGSTGPEAIVDAAEAATNYVAIQGVAATPTLFSNTQREPLVVSAPIWTVSESTRAQWRFRLFDVALASAFLILLWPVMLIAALLVKLSGRGPVIFRHVRVGQNGKPFVCLKFRTMENCAEDLLPDLLGACDTIRSEWQRDHKIRSDPRITTVGRQLRRFSVDELPQLVNVLRGDMSIVGPRPIVEAEIERYAASYGYYCSVKPGLTGLWQISGRNRVSYERRVELDCEYARTKSVWGDAGIILRTIPVVFQGNGC